MTRRGRQPTPDGRQALWMLPRHSGDGMLHLYACGLKDGKTKIGITNRPRYRLSQHWTSTRGAVAWVHLFSRHRAAIARAVEKAALAEAARIGQRVFASEVFHNLPREDCISCVRSAIAATAKAA